MRCFGPFICVAGSRSRRARTRRDDAAQTAGRGRVEGPVHIVRFSRHVLLVPRSSSRTIPNAPMPPPKPRRAAFRGFFFSGAGPDRRTAAGFNFRIGAAETPAECRCDQRPPCTPGDGAQDARILEVVAARSRGSHQMHPSLYAIAPMTRPITHNNALRLSLSPITRAPRSLTPPSLAAATRRLVVPNALLDTVPKGTRRQGGSGRRSARMAMLLRSCGWSGRVQEAGRMGGGTRTCAKHGRTRSLRRFEFKTFPADRPV